MAWHNFIEDHDTFAKFSQKAYQHHNEMNKPDYTYLEDTEVDETLFDQVPNREYISGGTFDGKNYPPRPQTDKELAIQTYQYDHPLVQQLNKRFRNDFGYAILIEQTPGAFAVPHVDKHEWFTKHFLEHANKEAFEPNDIFRAIIFLDDWQLGQFFCFGNTFVKPWKKHTCISFKWHVPHATANCSYKNRKILSYVGV